MAFYAKEEEIPFSQKLRIIQLFEGDLNAGLKYIIGKKLSWHLHDNKALDDEIYGSRKGKTGAEALIYLQLLADHSRIWKKILPFCSTTLQDVTTEFRIS